MDAAQVSPQPIPAKRNLKSVSLGVLLVAAVVMSLTMYDNRTSSRRTLQKIFDEDGTLSPLKITSVHQPITAGIPFYGTLSEIGLVPRRIEGSFQVEPKERGTLNNNCKLGEFDFTQTPTPSGQFTIGVPGIEVFKLRACAASL